MEKATDKIEKSVTSVIIELLKLYKGRVLIITAGNGNTNGLIRQPSPKRSSFEVIN